MKDSQDSHQDSAAGQGRLLARPLPTASDPWDAPHGEVSALELDGGRGKTLVYVPTGYQPEKPAPLVLLLHGAGGQAAHGLGLMRDHADDAGLILLAPSSRKQTWDVIQGGFGPDVSHIDRALEWVFARLAVDPERVAVSGFSDGASYALSLGLTNGDLFRRIAALSPGFMAPAARQGRPRVFVSHGTRDETLPIDMCSRRLVPALRHAGYDVDYQEFDGPHTVPPRIAQQAVDWLCQ